MNVTRVPLRTSAQRAFDVAVMSSCSSSHLQVSLPIGHSLSRSRLRHLLASERVVVSERLVPVGLAAYKSADSDVRVVHEFLMDRTLADRDAVPAVDALLAALELLALEDRVGCLMLLVSDGTGLLPAFARRGYTAIVVDSSGAWLQKKMDYFPWVSRRSELPH